MLEIHVNKVQNYCNLRQVSHVFRRGDGFLFLLCPATFYFFSYGSAGESG